MSSLERLAGAIVFIYVSAICILFIAYLRLMVLQDFSVLGGIGCDAVFISVSAIPYFLHCVMNFFWLKINQLHDYFGLGIDNQIFAFIFAPDLNESRPR